MRALFFFGTLRHLPLLEIVLGRPADRLEITAASLQNHGVYAVAEGPFPTIIAKKGMVADGIRVAGLSDEDIARIDFYEGGFAYELIPVTLRDGQTAEMYFASPDLWTPVTAWDLADWVAAYGPLSCYAAAEVMEYKGRKTADQVAQMFPMIRSRAAARLNASQSRHGAGTLYGEVDIIAVNRAYAAFFALDDFTLRHQRFDGAMSDPVDRAVFIASDAALVLPYDPVRDRVLLVEQLRMGPVARGDQAVWQLEPIAGRVDGGETPEEAAYREAMEEAGLSLKSLEPVAEVYASPGDSTEFYYIYLGIADLPDAVTGVCGVDAEDEDIRSHLLSFDDLMTLCDERRAANAPLVAAAYWLARHRDRLRLGGGGYTP